MEMQQLRYFVKLAELGSFTRAAEACFVSQPSLSQQIAKLEEEVGRPLFERLPRGAKLTDAGRLFEAHARNILQLTDDALTKVADSPDAGRLAVGAIPTIAPFILPELLAKFAEECPKAEIAVIEAVTPELLKLLNEGTVDVALLALPLAAPGLHVEKLFSEELLAVMPVNHPLAEKQRLRLEDLAAEPFVLLDDAHCLAGAALSFCRRHGHEPRSLARMQQLATVQELVRLGRGVSLVPEMARALDVSPGRVYRSIAGDKPSRTVALAWNSHRFLTKLFKRFVALVRKELAK